MSSLPATPEFTRRPKKRIPAHELADMISQYVALTKEGMSPKRACLEIAILHGRPETTVRYAIDRFRPSIEPARLYLKAQALKLAMRVVRKANVAEAVDILSRPGMDVLEPKSEGQPQGGFTLAISADSCGAVKMVAQGGVPTLGPGPEPDPEPAEVSWPTSEPEVGVLDANTFEPVAGEKVHMNQKGSKHKGQGSFLNREIAHPDKLEDIAARNRRLLKERREARALHIMDIVLQGETHGTTDDDTTPSPDGSRGTDGASG